MNTCRNEKVSVLPVVSLVILMAFALRMLWLGKQEFWFDEAASAFVAGKSTLGIISYIQGQLFEHPPGYFLLLHMWIRLAGTTEFALRYFSVLFGVLFVPLAWAIVKPWQDKALSFSTILVAAILPFQTVQSQEARMYTLLACVGALSIMALHRALASNSFRMWIAYGMVTAAGMGIHYYFALLPLAQSVYLVLFYRKSLWMPKKWAVTMAILYAPPLIWLLVSPGPRHAIEQSFVHWSFSQANPGDVARLGVETVLGVRGVPGFAVPDYLGAFAVVAIAVVGLVPAGRRLARHPLSGSALSHPLQFLLGCSVIMPLLASFLLPHNLVARYLSFSTAPLYALIGFGITTLGNRVRWLSVVALLVVTIVSAYGTYSYFSYTDKGQFGAGAKTVERFSLPGDAVVLTQPDQWPLTFYYFSGDLPVYYVPDDPQPPDDAAIETAMQGIAKGHDRIWLGPIGAWNLDPQGKVEAWLLKNYYRAFKQWLPGGTSVSLFVKQKSQLQGHSANYSLGTYLRLLRYALSEEPVRPSDAVRIRLDWQPDTDSPFMLLLGTRLVDSAGRVWATGTDVLSTSESASRSDDQRVETKRALYIPPGTPPGKYKVELSASLSDDESNLVFYDNAVGQATGATLPIGEVEVVRSDPSLSLPANSFLADAMCGDEIELMRPQEQVSKYHQSDNLKFGLTWRAVHPPDRDYRADFQIIDAAGHPFSEVYVPLTSAAYPTTQWQAREVLTGLYEISLPDDLPAGDYELQAALQDPTTGAFLKVNEERQGQALWGILKWKYHASGTSVALFPFSVSERERNFAEPSIAHRKGDNFGGQVKLVGFSNYPATVRAGDSFPLTLYWQAARSVDDSYTVFVHFLNQKGEVVAQQDIIPRGGGYPTNLWAAGEFVEDELSVPLPDSLLAGQYAIEIGLYNSATLARLPVVGPTGETRDDKIMLPSVSLVR